MLEQIQYEEGLPIKVQVLKVQEYPWHTHNDIQILYVLEGEIEVKMTYTRYFLSKNHMHFIHTDDVHGLKSLTDDNLVVVLSLNVDYFSQFYPDLDTEVFTTKHSKDVATYKRQLAMKALIFAIISEFYSRGKGYKSRLKDISLELMEALYKDFRGFTVDRVNRHFEHMISHDILQVERISRVVNLVYKNYPYKLSLASIAEQENINPYYLSHLFQKQIGDSFRNFVSMARVEMSEAQLLSTDTSISQISHNVGFSNAKYYIANFTDWFGCHPREYRQLYRDRILGRAPIRTKELPLESINSVIDSYSELPVFIGAHPAVHSVGVDLKKEPIATLKSAGKAPDLEKLYDSYDPHPQCVELVSRLLDPPHRLLELPTFDSHETPDGLLTVNGMRKPQYYLYQLLASMYKTVLHAEPFCMVTGQGENYQILFYNEGSDETHNYEFNLFKLSGNYQITERHFSGSSSCIQGWKPLHFKSELTDEEFESLQAMSLPRTSYQLISARGSYSCSASLEPQEICFLEIKKVEMTESKIPISACRS